MRSLTGRWLAAAFVMASAVSALPLAGAVDAPKVQFSDTRLKNGLRVIIAEDHTAPVFSIALAYNVGSRNERKGRTGFAHLFEHMMFKGSENVGSGEHFVLIFSNGGDMNGTTSKDRTNYFERLPANQLDLALFLEADRMRSLVITPENLDNQRHAVQEERRLRLDNQPYGRSVELLEELAYDNFPYEHSVIGSMEDLNAATLDDVAAFFKTYYAPNNAVLAIVGDVKTDECLAKVRKYFDSIPSQPAPAPVEAIEPLQEREWRETVADPLAKLPRVDIAYDIPSSLTPDHDALSVLATILSNGRSSRFYEAIVRQKQLAPNVGAFAGESRGPGLFRITGMASPGKAVAELEAAIYDEIERIKSGPIADWELEKARNLARRNFATGLGSSLRRAILLSEYALFHDDPGIINTRAERLAAVSAADVHRVAREYLIPQKRTVVMTIPKGTAP